MHDDDSGNDRTPSTRWVWQTRTIRVPAGGRSKRSAEGASQALSRRWDGRVALSVRIRYRGGPEAFYEVEARGKRYRFPGATAIHDVMEAIYEGKGGRRT